MDHRPLIPLLCFVALVWAVPVKKDDASEDLKPAEGRSHYSRASYGPDYGAPGPLYAPSSHAYDSPRNSYGPAGHVTSYNRRGHAKSEPLGPGPAYGARSARYSGPRDYAHAQPSAVYAHPPPSYGHGGSVYAPQPGGYGGYGPPNAISAHSQQYSQDPNYDPAKDPVSQYAEYVPIREYGPKKHSDNRELSIYGYKK